MHRWLYFGRRQMRRAYCCRFGIGDRDGLDVFASDRIALIEWLKAGYPEVGGGPIRLSGYYVAAYCDPMCCRPEGPYRTKRDALLALQRTYGPTRRDPWPRKGSDENAVKADLQMAYRTRQAKIREKIVSDPYFAARRISGRSLFVPESTVSKADEDDMESPALEGEGVGFPSRKQARSEPRGGGKCRRGWIYPSSRFRAGCQKIFQIIWRKWASSWPKQQNRILANWAKEL